MTLFHIPSYCTLEFSINQLTAIDTNIISRRQGCGLTRSELVASGALESGDRGELSNCYILLKVEIYLINKKLMKESF